MTILVIDGTGRVRASLAIGKRIYDRQSRLLS
jgi:hypothetical protein